MNDTDHLLVVAERAADPGDLVRMLARRAHAARLDVTVLVPATLYGLGWAGDPHAAMPEAARYAERLRALLAHAGVEVRRTLVGDPDPHAAIEDALADDGGFAEVLISRPPKRFAEMLRLDLPHRVEQATDAPVTYLRSARLARAERRRGRRQAMTVPQPEPGGTPLAA